MAGEWIPLIGGAISAGGSALNTRSAQRTAKRNVDKTIEAQKAESELAYQRDMEMWRLNNEYNSPEAQMARFKSAGLSPHLIYGQGNPGNASTPVRYQPADIRYAYEAPTYGSSIQAALPMLMNIGSWMLDMQAKKADIKKTEVDTARSVTETDRVRQLIEFLLQRNPQVLKEGSNRLSLFPYQRDMLDYQTNAARTKLFELEQEFRYKYGEGLFEDLGSAWSPSGGKFADVGGMKRLQFLQEQSKTKLLDAKASWSDFDVTDPQAIMMLVLNGVMGLAGQTLRLSTHRRPKVTNEVEERMKTGRTRIRRTVRE